MSQVRAGDLVLEVSQQSDFNLEPYERFIQQLTRIGGEHQADAIRIACRYLLGGHYTDLHQLAAANWDANANIREHYGEQRDRFLEAQQLGSLLAASIDHATGTGKSFVIFGVATIALASGLVDRVLVLCPSTTIEAGLLDKFTRLVADSTIMDLLPEDALIARPNIVTAYEQTVVEGEICVENIHAAYDKSASSIRDSFSGRGARTLVINDEAHHIYSVPRGQRKKWLDFLHNDVMGFRRVLNVSGTCFIGDDYFPDVIHRYSLQQARDDRRIKNIRYWGSNRDFSSAEARWSAVLDNHEANGTAYPAIKPITIFVCEKVNTAKQLHQDFMSFLVRDKGKNAEEADDLTLIVTSAPEHAANVARLRSVDQRENKAEFIFSVSMLTEGWDVKNVLQIVPHEKRAFDSKLLISQVLGRGLRLLPPPYQLTDASVIVFNHARWAPEIKRLFDDVWEDDQRLYAHPISTSGFHLELDQLEVRREQVEVDEDDLRAQGRAAGAALRLAPQREIVTQGQLIGMRNESEERVYAFDEDATTISAVLNDVEAKMAARALEEGEEDGELDRDTVTAEVRAALADVGAGGDVVSDTNRARILHWLMPVPPRRRASMRTTVRRLVQTSTKDLPMVSVRRSDLARGNATIAVLSDNDTAVRWPNHDTGQYELLDTVLADEDLPKKAIEAVTEGSRWRTPTDIVAVSHEPERRFLRELLKGIDQNGVSAWVKSPDVGFYSIEYAVERRGVTRNAKFNPDWFLRVADDFLVVETKMDGDTSDENKAKLKFAKDHFAAVNELRKDEPGTYYFYFVAPADYAAFFGAIRDGTYPTFVSRLQSDLR